MVNLTSTSYLAGQVALLGRLFQALLEFQGLLELLYHHLVQLVLYTHTHTHTNNDDPCLLKIGQCSRNRLVWYFVWRTKQLIRQVVLSPVLKPSSRLPFSPCSPFWPFMLSMRSSSMDPGLPGRPISPFSPLNPGSPLGPEEPGKPWSPAEEREGT